MVVCSCGASGAALENAWTMIAFLSMTDLTQQYVLIRKAYNKKYRMLLNHLFWLGDPYISLTHGAAGSRQHISDLFICPL